MFELLEKPRRYKKDKNKDLFKKFNEKLKEYNSLVSQDAPENLRITVLQEIDFFLEDLKLKTSDSNLKISITPCLRKILEWNELPKALGHLNISSPSKLPMEKQLFDRTTDVGSLMTKKEWLEALKDSQKVELIKAIGIDLKNYTLITNNIDKYYSLKQIQTKLLSAINDQNLDKDEQQAFRKLSLQINTELSKIIKHTPELNKRYEAHAFLAEDLREHIKNFQMNREELALALREYGKSGKIDPENLERYLNQLDNGDEDLISIIIKCGIDFVLPPHYQSTPLSRGNNITWKITDTRTEETFTIRIEKPLMYPLLVDKLSQSELNEYFSQDYLSSSFVIANRNFVISEYAVKKDMRSNRKDNNSSSDSELIKGTTKDLVQILDFSKKLLANGAMHSDIKLSNFLLHSDGSMFIADKKALIPINPDGKVNTKDIATTMDYAPPEYRQIAGEDIDINAEQFMSYQIGLALYEHLVLPEFEDKPGVKLWMEQPLDFSAEIFKSPVGLKMQELIEKATRENPEERIGLKDLHAALEQIQLQCMSKEELEVQKQLELEKQLEVQEQFELQKQLEVQEQLELQEQLQVSKDNLTIYINDYKEKYQQKYGNEGSESIKSKKIELGKELFSIIDSKKNYSEKAKDLEEFIKKAPAELKHKNIIHELRGSEFTLVKMAKEMLNLMNQLHEAEVSLAALENQENKVTVQHDPEYSTEQGLLLSLDEVSPEDLEKYLDPHLLDSSKAQDSQPEKLPMKKQDPSLILDLTPEQIKEHTERYSRFKERLCTCKGNNKEETEKNDDTEGFRL